MKKQFNRIKNYLLELNYNITHEDPSEGILMIQNENEGINNLIIGIASPILIIEQYIFKITNPDETIFQQLLQKNRDIVHGAFVLDETGTKVIFRDTLQIENLDLNELEGSINSLSLLLSEYSENIIQFSKA
ncbi:molecular chaperone Tir [Tenacibaculum finnmarkense genomovar finnmarkense]|uniref:Molecular chaperone Tir n=1 Tax=Tenacibaculum finnmarkense genomovar finnmarkense TaxID=1458503 RepID=A0AAP1REG1_9FLAO|nr:molecular chaperone Tir [Tenacibaculum finnmarkense]MBE7652279.1 molecular chaperone Tir [Tenacibaculum finnmarkense genomovar finnmarkense]MBE7659327.1 molecular chaperone Tir [Tenacibaculum finnmarkense genomovar finnmarkense]MBE7691458.1 molecular chaperone Tir [Tenacibaculum finnmarkense genomovar finnmarkense]MBE7694549.1 molecular chaperone Tir [Tenacibaculum finnmarkense genomovar finnmarkense]MCD8402044.1 YbjN domain-containing protein [Tenacibaculum finnmarkense genomovar finnmarke